MDLKVTGFIPSSSRASYGYIAYYPGFQASSDTSVTDRSGKGNNATFNALTTGEAWANANCLSVPVTAAHHPSIAKATMVSSGFTWNASQRDSLIVAARLKVTVPAGSATFMGNANGTSEGGLKFNLTDSSAANGKWSVNLYDQVNTQSHFGSSGSNLSSSWTTNYHSILYYLDGQNNVYSMYTDGVIDIGATAITAGVTTLTPTSNSFDFCILGTSQVAAAGQVASLQSFHMLYVPSSVASKFTINIAGLASRLYRSPNVIVQKTEVGW